MIMTIITKMWRRNIPESSSKIFHVSSYHICYYITLRIFSRHSSKAIMLLQSKVHKQEMKPHPTNDNRGKSRQMHENDDTETKIVFCRISFDFD